MTPATRSHSLETVSNVWQAVTMAQPHKGDRVYIAGRVDHALAAMMRDEARARGVSLSDVLQVAVAARYGHPELAPAFTTSREEELPLTG